MPTLGDNDTNKIESLNSVIGKYLGKYEGMSVAATKLLTITAHRIKRQKLKNAEGYPRSQEYSFVGLNLNNEPALALHYNSCHL